MRIQATILVERESQKGILIGRGRGHAQGHRHRGPPGRSRSSWARKVYLGLFVKVKERWREDARTLQQMGLATGSGEAEG